MNTFLSTNRITLSTRYILIPKTGSSIRSNHSNNLRLFFSPHFHLLILTIKYTFLISTSTYYLQYENFGHTCLLKDSFNVDNTPSVPNQLSHQLLLYNKIHKCNCAIWNAGCNVLRYPVKILRSYSVYSIYSYS